MRERERGERNSPQKGEAGQNNGIVTRLWMRASMKPMVCKTPREGGEQKGYGGNTLEIARVSSVSAGERKRQREKSTKGENREAASVL